MGLEPRLPVVPETAARTVRLAVLGTLGLLAVGVGGNWPWLVTEVTRLDPAHRVLIWAGEGTALLWVLWAGLWYGVLGRPPRPTGLGRAGLVWVAVTLGVGMAADVATTALSAYQEAEGKGRAVAAVRAELTDGRTSANGEYAYVSCRFQDRQGAWHDSRIDLQLVGHRPALDVAVRAGQYPIPADVTYDPEWPPRCWIAPAGFDEHQPIYLLSLCGLLFQGMLIVMAVAYRWKPEAAAWFPLEMFVPVWGLLLPLGCGAVGKALLGEF